MSEFTTMLWLEQNRWLAAAVSGSVALHSAVLAFAPGPAQHTKPPAPLIVRVEDSHPALREAQAAVAAPASDSPLREAHAAPAAPASHSALREAHSAPPPQHIQRAQKPVPQATASLRSDVDKKPPGPPEPAPVALAAVDAPLAEPVALPAGGAPPVEPAERPMEARVALLTATPAASPGQGPASIDRAAPASAAGEQRAALDKITPPGGSGPSDESDRGVAYLYSPVPEYPLEARRQHLEGEVLLQVRVDRTGEPREARIARSSGVALLDEAALTGVRAWRFTAAKHGNTPIEHWVAVPIRFKLEGRHLD